MEYIKNYGSNIQLKSKYFYTELYHDDMNDFTFEENIKAIKEDLADIMLEIEIYIKNHSSNK